jgi:hypothetical protein
MMPGSTCVRGRGPVGSQLASVVCEDRNAASRVTLSPSAATRRLKDHQLGDDPPGELSTETRIPEQCLARIQPAVATPV